MVITSMNMYAFSEKNNREMGVLIDRIIDKDLFEKAVSETCSILQSSEQIALRNVTRQFGKDWNNFENGLSSSDGFKRQIRGYCIRCEVRINYDPERPFCFDCFAVWVQYENPDYQENVCHRCGKYESTTMLKPQCYSCFDIWRHEY